MASKRKHVTLTLKLKQEILEQLEKGVSGKLLARKYGIGTSTVSDIKKRKHKLQSFIAKCDSNPGSRRTLKQGEYPEMENELYTWIMRQKNNNIPISYELLALKAKHFFKKCYGKSDFNASGGWITNFKRRHGVLKIRGGKVTNDSSVVDCFKKRIDEKIKTLNLSPSQIYSASSSPLLWKFLPNTKNTEKLTFMVCSNAEADHKLQPLVIGKPDSLETSQNAELPVGYRSAPNASMTSALFKEWLHRSFTTQVKIFAKTHNRNEKVLLLVDNTVGVTADEDLVSEDGKIEILVLPPNCTALIQNVTRLTKLFYREGLLLYILSLNKKCVTETLEGVDFRKAAGLLFNAWENVSSDILRSCWNILLDQNSDDEATPPVIQKSITFEREALQRISDMLKKVTITSNISVTECEVKTWIEDDDSQLLDETDESREELNESSASTATDTDEVKVEMEDFKNYRTSEDDSEEFEDADIKEEKVDVEELYIETANSVVSSEEALHCFNVCLKWAEENNACENDILILRRLKERAILVSGNVSPNKQMC